MDVFISYKSDRRAAAEHIAEVLRAHGYSVWFDYQLVTGRDFSRQIDAELLAAKVVLVLWCDLSTESDWVRSEARYAKRRGKYVPMRLASCELPVEFEGDQTIDLTNWSGEPRPYEPRALLDAVARQVGRTLRPDIAKLDALAQAWRRYGAQPPKALPISPALAEQSGSAPSFGGGQGRTPQRYGGLVLWVALSALTVVALGSVGFAAYQMDREPALSATATGPLANGFGSAAVLFGADVATLTEMGSQTLGSADMQALEAALSDPRGDLQQLRIDIESTGWGLAMGRSESRDIVWYIRETSLAGARFKFDGADVYFGRKPGDRQFKALPEAPLRDVPTGFKLAVAEIAAGPASLSNRSDATEYGAQNIISRSIAKAAAADPSGRTWRKWDGLEHDRFTGLGADFEGLTIRLDFGQRYCRAFLQGEPPTGGQHELVTDGAVLRWVGSAPDSYRMMIVAVPEAEFPRLAASGFCRRAEDRVIIRRGGSEPDVIALDFSG